MHHTVFITGATGFIGAGLVQAWLDRSDATITVLARAKRGVPPDRRVRNVLAELYAEPDLTRVLQRVRVVEGDVTADRFGLRDGEYERLTSETTHLIHCAAAARFDLELEDARRENVGGTRNALELARRCGGLRRMAYISTAYVAGKREGLIKESELDEGQEYNNTYEKTKLEAERLVRQNIPNLPITILRPSIVICDSQTGRGTDHNGFYRVLRMYWRDELKVLPGSPGTRLDLVPIDYVVAASYAISASETSSGHCYHLAAGPDFSTSLAEIVELVSFHFGKKTPRIVPPEEFASLVAAKSSTLSEEERSTLDELLLYLPYLSSNIAFDTSNARTVWGLTPPRVETYVGVMAEYVMRH